MSDAAALPMLPFSRPLISEAAIAEVAETLRSGWITSGPKVAAFERDFSAYVGAKHAVAVCSATAGLDLALGLLDLQPGDEVITPSLTWVSVPNLIELHGARCVFADVRADDLQLDPRAVRALVGPRTRAVVPVHYAGAPCDLAALRAAVGPDIPIIEDAAHAAGSRLDGVPIGGATQLAVFSFHPTKNMTTAEGGMIVCADDAWAERLRRGRFHGIRKDAWRNATRSGKDTYAVIAPGRKYNLTDIQAVLGIHQLRALDAMNAERARLAQRYLALLAGSRLARPLALPGPGALHAWHLFVVLIDTAWARTSRAEVVDRLERRGIGTGVHFAPVHRQDYYAAKYPGLSLPVTAVVGDQLLSLPLFPGMSDSDLERVVAALTAIERELAS